jgi:Protein of unknown function (DUF2975)
MGIWLLVGFGLFLELLIIPMVSQELPNRFTELAGDGILIQLNLTSITIAGQLILISISALLRRISNHELLSAAALGWVNTLVVSAMTLAALLILLFAWLTSQDATGPAVAFSLIGGILLVATLGLVTISLRSVLREAITNRLELEGVI